MPRAHLLLAACALLVASTARAESPPDEPEPLEVVVQGARPSGRGTSVQKVDRDRFRLLGASTVAEAVATLPSALDAANVRGERMLTLRGFSQRQLLVMIDGVPVSVPYDGQIDTGKLPLGVVEHVTVVKGAGSLLYGPNGLGGAINISTRRPGEGPRVRVSTEGSALSTTSSAVVTERAGDLAGTVGATYDRGLSFPLPGSFVPGPNEGGGRRDNADRRSVGWVGKVSWQADDANTVVATGTHLGGEFGVPPGVYDLAPRYWRWSAWDVTTMAVAHAYRSGGWDLDETVYASWVSNTLDSYDDGSYRTQRLPRAFESTYEDGSVGGHLRGAMGLGSGWRVRGWLGGKRDGHREPGASGVIRADTLLWTGAGQVEGKLSAVDVLAGVQVDGELPGEGGESERPGASLGVGPMIRAGVWMTKWLAVSATAAERTRFPTLRERFSEAFGARAPNPDLGPERATHLSLDAEAVGRHGRAAVGLFDAEVRDLIIPVVTQPQIEQFQNTGRARLLGVEAEATVTPSWWLQAQLGWAALHARRLDLAPPEDVIPYQPEHNGLLAVTVRPWGWASLTLAARYVGAQRFQNPDTLAWGELGGSRRFDARAEVRPMAPLRVWLRASNLTDARILRTYSYPEPGRQVFAGAEVEL